MECIPNVGVFEEEVDGGNLKMAFELISRPLGMERIENHISRMLYRAESYTSRYSMYSKGLGMSYQ